MNTRTALTDTTDTNTLSLHAASGTRQLLRVRVDTDTRFKLYDDECDRTPVYTTRARHTDSPSERRILNYGDKKKCCDFLKQLCTV